MKYFKKKNLSFGLIFSLLIITMFTVQISVAGGGQCCPIVTSGNGFCSVNGRMEPFCDEANNHPLENHDHCNQTQQCG